MISSGQVAIANSFDTSGSCVLFGGVGVGGVVSATSTDNYCLDMFVAIPQGSGVSNGTLSGNYSVGGMEYASGSLNVTRNVLFNMTADGKGGLGNITVNGSSQGLSDKSTTQTLAGATYSLNANGSGTMTLPVPTGVTTAASQLITGAKNLYVSPDGSFFVSGSATGWDIQIGVKALIGEREHCAQWLIFHVRHRELRCDRLRQWRSLYSFGGSVNPVTSVGDDAAAPED